MTATAPATARPRRRAGRVVNPAYTGYDLRRNLRMLTNLFFIVGLPVTMYLIFGANSEFSDFELESGRGNVSAQIMVSMAVYGAITATVSLAGSAAVELQQGWGRQLGLTPFTQAGYVLSKVVVALVYAALPIIAVFAVGALTAARVDGMLWLGLAGLALAAAVVFALYGLMFGLLFRSEAAVGAASGTVVILMFLGNAFMPLSGFLLDLSPYTPVWGVMQFANWPLTEGLLFVGTEGGTVQYELWQPVANLLVWAAVFGAVALWAARRHTARK